MVTVFHETVNYCFNSVLETMGTAVREVVYEHLAKKGIEQSDVFTRFDDIVRILTESFGASARVIIYKTVAEIHQQYSMRADFTYKDSLRDHLSLLRERVVTDHLLPKRIQREDPSLAQRLVPMIQSSGSGSSNGR